MNSAVSERTVIPILWDHLNLNTPSLLNASKSKDIILMVEPKKNSEKVNHHKKKLIFLISSMRHFAKELQENGWIVKYIKMRSPENSGSLRSEILHACKSNNISNILLTEPGNWQLRETLKSLQNSYDYNVKLVENNNFFATHSTFSEWASNRKELRLEYFYRMMRVKTGILIKKNKPTGGRWNYDKENRGTLSGSEKFKPPLQFKPDDITQEVIDDVNIEFSGNFGSDRNFWFGVTRSEAEVAFDYFLKHNLANFGKFQDAMDSDSSFLSHAVISMYLNAGLLDPITVCKKVEASYISGQVPLNSAEGFIRQILGWREFIRGIYWMSMPGYENQNFFNFSRSLPKFFWTGDTELQCLKSTIQQTNEEAYAHHIQRLMITGNFSLLAGINPKEVHQWYLAVYADAHEWVELPNTIGMSQYADGGMLASKPYISGGAYINKMSNYCGNCRFNVKKRNGPDACPFNYLYWNFLDKNQTRLNSNPRLRLPYNSLSKFDKGDLSKLRADSKKFLKGLV